MAMHEHRDHRHAVTLDDTFDFLNTDELDGSGRPIERLPTLAEATRWLVEHGLLHPEDAVLIEAHPRHRPVDPLVQVHVARAGLREIVEAFVAGRPAAADALTAVNRVLRAQSVPELVEGAGSTAVGHRHVGDPLDDALAGVCQPLVALVAAGDADRLRICANDGCRWVFHDTSPTGRRRWCSMASCGNRAKAARHRARRRQAIPSGAASGAPVRPAG
jgi:predicted RNA-binding Zn ribbon-like protein